MHPKYWKSGRKAVYYKPMDGDASGGGGALDANTAAAALDSLFGGEQGQAESAESTKEEEESPEAAAERIAAEEAGANQEPAADGEQGDAYNENETVTVMIDGKPVELTKAQIAEAKKGELRQADYTRKTQEAAEVRKAAEAETQKARAERETYAQQLQQILAVNQFHEQQEGEWTAERIEADPVGWMIAQQSREQRKAQNQQAQAELQRLSQQHQQEREQALLSYRAEQQEKLLAKLPEWKDADKARAEAPKIKEYLAGQEFEQGEIDGINDHRLILLARKAMQFDALMERAKDTAQKVAKAPPKVEAPGRQPVTPTDGRTAAMKQLKQSGKVADAASIFAQML